MKTGAMNTAFFLALFAAVTLYAETQISKHNTQYVPVENARELLLEAGCVRVARPTQTEQYKLIQDGDTYVVEGNRLTVSCAKWPDVPVTVTARLSWSPPPDREDGAPLALDDIASYIVTHNGTVTPIASGATAAIIEGLAPGEHFFTVQTVDTGGQISDAAAPVRLTVQ